MSIRTSLQVVVALTGAVACSGCMGVRWSWNIDDGAVYETNRKAYVIDGRKAPGLLWRESEQDGLMFSDAHLDLYEVRGELSPKTRIREVRRVGIWGFSWWFGPYSLKRTFGEILDGSYKGRLVDFGHAREECPQHGWWYLCPLDCPSRNLKCLTPDKYDDEHIGGTTGKRRGGSCSP